MSTGRRQLKRTAGTLLPADVYEIEPIRDSRSAFRLLNPPRFDAPSKVRTGLSQIGNGDRLDSGQSCFGSGFLGADDPA